MTYCHYVVRDSNFHKYQNDTSLLKLSSAPQPHTEASTSIDEEIQGIQLNTNHRMIVDLDATLSHGEDDVSIYSGGFNDRDNNINEDSHGNRLHYIYHLAPSQNAEGRTWIAYH